MRNMQDFSCASLSGTKPAARAQVSSHNFKSPSLGDPRELCLYLSPILAMLLSTHRNDSRHRS
jgi:hypothetical protein